MHWKRCEHEKGCRKGVHRPTMPLTYACARLRLASNTTTQHRQRRQAGTRHEQQHAAAVAPRACGTPQAVDVLLAAAGHANLRCQVVGGQNVHSGF